MVILMRRVLILEELHVNLFRPLKVQVTKARAISLETYLSYQARAYRQGSHLKDQCR